MRFGNGNSLNLLSIGDSQTAERSSLGGATIIQTYPFLIARRKGYANVTNVGISGNTTTQMEARFSADVLAHRPGAISIMGLVNDMTTNISAGSWTGAGTSVATTKAKLKAMVQAGQAARARVTLISPYPIREAVYLNNYAAYGTALSEIASETSCEYLDLYSLVNALTSGQQDAIYITADTNHPNAAGHLFLADAISGSQFGQY